MSAIYHQGGIDFQYPENWILIDQSPNTGVKQFVLEAPDGSLLTLVFQSLLSDRTLLAQELVGYFAQEFPDAEALPAEEELVGAHGQGFDCEVFYLDLLVSAWVRVFAGPRHLIGVLAQAESRDFARQQMVFKAVVASALRDVEPHDAGRR